MGQFIPEISEMFPNQEVIARELPSFDAFEVKKPGTLLRSWLERSW